MSGDPMTPARELRDRVAEAKRRRSVGTEVTKDTPWAAVSPSTRAFWLAEADDLIADLASLNLAIVEKDAPHE